MRFNQSKQQSIISALSNAGVELFDIIFHTNGKVTVLSPVTDEKEIAWSSAGIFTFLKPAAWQISDAIGNGNEVEFFVARRQGVMTASFVVEVDMARAERRAKPPVEKPETNWLTDRQELLANVADRVQAGEEIETVAAEIAEQFYVGHSPRHAALRLAQDVAGLLTPPAEFETGQDVWVVVEYQGKVVRIKGQIVDVTPNCVMATSNRTQLTYQVPFDVVFSERPPKNVTDTTDTVGVLT